MLLDFVMFWLDLLYHVFASFCQCFCLILFSFDFGGGGGAGEGCFVYVCF